MLSILIPVYNFDVNALVSDLHRQAIDCGIAFEIRCYDDGSTEAFRAKNRAIQTMGNVVWVELEQNIGRSALS